MTEEQHVQKGFNHGYFLEKHDPDSSEMFRSALQANEDHPYAIGFVAGCKEYKIELAQSRDSPMSKYLNPKKDTSVSKDEEQEKEGLDL